MPIVMKGDTVNEGAKPAGLQNLSLLREKGSIRHRLAQQRPFSDNGMVSGFPTVSNEEHEHVAGKN